MSFSLNTPTGSPAQEGSQEYDAPVNVTSTIWSALSDSPPPRLPDSPLPTTTTTTIDVPITEDGENEYKLMVLGAIQEVKDWKPDQDTIIEPLSHYFLSGMLPEEKKDYYDALVDLKQRFPDHPMIKEKIPNEINRVHLSMNQNKVFTEMKTDILNMNKEQVQSYLKDLKSMNQSGMDSDTGDRLRFGIKTAEEHLKSLEMYGDLPSPSTPIESGDQSGDPPTGDQSGDRGKGKKPAKSGDTPKKSGDPVPSTSGLRAPYKSPPSPYDTDNEDDDDDNNGRRHKNVDQDTASKAMKTKLGKGDYQTIAETTTVTTVRRGKRPVVEREHKSTTIPGPGSQSDDGDER